MRTKARELEARSHWLLVPLLIYSLTQLLNFALLLEAKDRQEAIPAQDEGQYFIEHHSQDPPWVDYVAGWNGQSYREVATNGYPDGVIRDEQGQVMRAPWVSFPLFPALTRIPMSLGLDFGYSAIVVNGLFALGAMLILYGWIVKYTGKRWPAALAVASLSLAPPAAIFQLAYAEAVALFFLVLTLFLVHSKKYLWAVPAVLMLGLARPIGVPDVLLLTAHGLLLAWPSLRANGLKATLARVLHSRQGWHYGAILVASCAATVLWPFTSYLLTGESAYLLTHAAYFQESVFFSWLSPAVLEASPAYPLTPLLMLGVFGLWACWQAFGRPMKIYPPILRIWPVFLALYIFSTTAPVGNEQRYLLLGLFLYPWPTIPKKQEAKIVYFGVLVLMVLLAVYLQWSWINYHWISEPGALRKNV